MARASAKAVVIGVIANVALSLTLGVVVLFVWGRILVSGGKTQLEIARELPVDPTFLLIALVIGLVSLVVGGFVAGRIAGRNYLLNGALVGGISLAIALLIGAGAHPLWFRASSVVLEIPAATLGALIAKKRASGASEAVSPIGA
jgi:putative membrane protein (TIGR04086 family)